MSQTQILHNPRCSKSRQTLALLEEKSIDFEVVEYLKTPLTVAELTVLLTKLGFDSALDMVRVKEAEFKQAGLSNTSSNEDILAGIAAYPKLLERPVVITAQAAKIGRPPENVLEIL